LFAGEESNEDGTSDILHHQSHFIRDDLMCNSLEYFLDIYESEEFDGESMEDEDEEDEDDEKPKKKKEEKKVNI